MRADTVITKVSENATESWVTSYGFLNPTADTTTTLVNSITYNTIGLSFSYSYNNLGNITEIKENNVLRASYEYDYLNQLTRDNNSKSGKTTTYNYDNGGNIFSKTIYDYTTGSIEGLTGTVVQYAYGDSNWKDKLTAYNGNTITYDEIGNPLNYYNGTTFEWGNGRKLVRATKQDGTYMSYRYDDSGVRIRKSVNGVATDYLVDGTKIIAEKTGNDTIWYYYDAAGARIGFIYNGTPYYYIYNAQGDVLGLFNSGQQIVALYNYNAWGKITSITNEFGAEITDTTHIAHVNPFRYRGYYYDAETELYYLNSRYYDPEIGRFINADGYVSTGQDVTGNNMFAYCGNNPVNRIDYMGQSWYSIFSFATAVLACVALISKIVEKLKPKPEPYKSADEAAMAFANATYSSSKYIRHEYGTAIYSRTIKGHTTYNFTTPIAGSPHSVSVGNIKTPFGTTKVATAHTHPNSDNFSGLKPGATRGDIPNAVKRGLDSYVIGPNLKLQKYSISSGKVSVIGTASPISLTNQQQSNLVSQFKVSWDSHFDDCDFDCVNMSWPTQ